jgi:predicted nucleotidyltransferase component of viral defense system
VIPQAYITGWRRVAPWADDAQVEQDLILSRAVVQIFNVPELAGKFALRGGTALNKLFLADPARYSEDIDLVQVAPAPIGPLLDALRGTLDPWLGEPRRSVKQMVNLVYRFESEVPPVRPLRLKVEINTHEHFSVLGYQRKHMEVDSRWFAASAEVPTYALDELMGTKLRALYQRRKGRDLFDLWLCLERQMIDPAIVIQCFSRYMEAEHHAVTRAQFEQNLHEKSHDAAFFADIIPLLAADVAYDPDFALRRVREAFIERLHGEPWRGIDKSQAE